MSSLTLVSGAANAALSHDQLPEAAVETTDSTAEKKHPHLRLVSPDMQAQILKEMAASRRKRKPRKKAVSDAEAKVEKTKKAKPATEKKPRKTPARKAKALAEAAPAVSVETALDPYSSHIEIMGNAKLKAIADLMASMSRAAQAKASGDGLQLVPLLTDVIEHGNPEELAGIIDAAIGQLEITESEVAAEPVAKEIYAFNRLGSMFVSEERDPFKDGEWILFKDTVHSMWYDTSEEAMDGLHQFLVDAKLNFARETEILTRPFYIADYAYKKYAFKAVVGLYFTQDEHEDQKVCREQCVEINEYVVPLAKVAMRENIRKHLKARENQLVPSRGLTDAALNFTSIGLGVFLLYTLVVFVINTGVLTH